MDETMLRISALIVLLGPIEVAVFSIYKMIFTIRHKQSFVKLLKNAWLEICSAIKGISMPLTGLVIIAGGFILLPIVISFVVGELGKYFLRTGFMAPVLNWAC